MEVLGCKVLHRVVGELPTVIAGLYGDSVPNSQPIHHTPESLLLVLADAKGATVIIE